VYPLTSFSEPARLCDHVKRRAPLPGFLFGHADTKLTALHVETEIAPEIWQRMAFAPNHSPSHPDVRPLLRFGFWENSDSNWTVPREVGRHFTMIAVGHKGGLVSLSGIVGSAGSGEHGEGGIDGTEQKNTSHILKLGELDVKEFVADLDMDVGGPIGGAGGSSGEDGGGEGHCDPFVSGLALCMELGLLVVALGGDHLSSGSVLVLQLVSAQDEHGGSKSGRKMSLMTPLYKQLEVVNDLDPFLDGHMDIDDNEHNDEGGDEEDSDSDGDLDAEIAAAMAQAAQIDGSGVGEEGEEGEAGDAVGELPPSRNNSGVMPPPLPPRGAADATAAVSTPTSGVASSRGEADEMEAEWKWRCVQTLAVHTVEVKVLAVTDTVNGPVLGAADQAGVTTLTTLATGNSKSLPAASGLASAMKFSRDGILLCMAFENGSIKVFNAETGVRVAVVAETCSAPPRGVSAAGEGLVGAAGHGGIIQTPACTSFLYGQLIVSVVADHVAVHTCDDLYRAGGGGGASNSDAALSPPRSSDSIDIERLSSKATHMLASVTLESPAVVAANVLDHASAHYASEDKTGDKYASAILVIVTMDWTAHFFGLPDLRPLGADNVVVPGDALPPMGARCVITNWGNLLIYGHTEIMRVPLFNWSALEANDPGASFKAAHPRLHATLEAVPGPPPGLSSSTSDGSFDGANSPDDESSGKKTRRSRLGFAFGKSSGDSAEDRARTYSAAGGSASRPKAMANFDEVFHEKLTSQGSAKSGYGDDGQDEEEEEEEEDLCAEGDIDRAGDNTMSQTKRAFEERGKALASAADNTEKLQDAARQYRAAAKQKRKEAEAEARRWGVKK